MVGESEFGVLVEEFDDLLFHGGLFLGVGGVEFFDDTGDFFLFDFLLVFFELLHGLFDVFLFVGVSGDDDVVFLLEGLELVFELLDIFSVFLVLLGEEFVLVEVGIELAEFDFEGFDFVEVLFVELFVGSQFIGLLLAHCLFGVQLFPQVVYCDVISLSLQQVLTYLLSQSIHLLLHHIHLLQQPLLVLHHLLILHLQLLKRYLQNLIMLIKLRILHFQP